MSCGCFPSFFKKDPELQVEDGNDDEIVKDHCADEIAIGQTRHDSRERVGSLLEQGSAKGDTELVLVVKTARLFDGDLSPIRPSSPRIEYESFIKPYLALPPSPVKLAIMDGKEDAQENNAGFEKAAPTIGIPQEKYKNTENEKRIKVREKHINSESLEKETKEEKEIKNEQGMNEYVLAKPSPTVVMKETGAFQGEEDEEMKEEMENDIWMELKDAWSGRLYYFSEKKGISTWRKPPSFDKQRLQQAREERKKGLVEWVEAKDLHGRTYYYDRFTMQSRWDRPPSLSIPKLTEKLKQKQRSRSHSPKKSRR